MQCLYCGGALEWASDKARCSRCLNLFQHQAGQLTPVVVQAPGGGFNPEFNQMFQEQLGFGPPPPGAMPRPPGPAQPAQGQGGGGFLGGIVPEGLNIKIHGVAPVPIDFNSGGIGVNQKKLEKKLEDRAKSAIVSWIIGAVILGIIVLGAIGLGIYIWLEVKNPSKGVGTPTAGGDDTAWDGKTPFTCDKNEEPKITGTVANLPGKTAITVKGNCHLTLENVQITAAIGIDASSNGQVVMNGGSINATTNTAVASGNSQIVIKGAKVTGTSKKSGNGKVSTN